MPVPKKLNPREAYEAVQRILGRPGRVTWTRHSSDRGTDRQFDAQDMQRVLWYGTVQPNPRWSATHQNWVYTMTGSGYDNEPLSIKIAIIDEDDRIVVITGHDV